MTFQLSIFVEVVLAVLAFGVINGRHTLYKVVAFGFLVLEIPILTTGQFYVTDSGTVLQWTFPVLISSSLVLATVWLWFLVLYHAIASRAGEEEGEV